MSPHPALTGNHSENDKKKLYKTCIEIFNIYTKGKE